MNIVSKNEVDAWLADQLSDQGPAGGCPQLVIDDVCRRLAAYTGRIDWGPSSVVRTEYHNGGSRFVFPDYWPILSVTSIHDDVDHVFDAGSLVDSTDYVLSTREDGAIMFENYRTTLGDESIKLIYAGGYASETDAAIPAQLKLAAYLQCRYECQRQIPGTFNQFSGSRESEDTLGQFGLVPEVVDLLRQYVRRIPVA